MHQAVNNDEKTNNSSQTLTSINPATNDVVWQGNCASDSEIQDKVHAARQALKLWSNLPLNDRIDYLTSYQQELQSNKQDIALAISLETGKPDWEAATEVGAMINKVKLSIQAFYDRTNASHQKVADHDAYVRYKPHGVMAVLGPFNFPGHLPNGHIVPALLAGNTVVFKPSEYTPLVAEKMLSCWQRAGLPEGVLSVVHGDKHCGQSLLNSDINGVLFTGSYATGQLINQHFSSRPEIILALEMGGNSPLIIDNYLDNIDAAIYHSLTSAYITAGQRCSCARRLIVPNNNYGDDFIQRFIEKVNKIAIGKHDDSPQPFMGPVIAKSQALNHLKAQQNLIDSGAKVLIEMKHLDSNSAFLSPGLLDMTGVDNQQDNEIFAPLLQVLRYENFEHAISLANQTNYGLAAGLFSDEPSNYQQFFQQINAGIVNWNRPITGASSQAPFGGIGKSGNHRPSAYFAADYCSYPIASLEQNTLTMPESLMPGLNSE